MKYCKNPTKIILWNLYRNCLCYTVKRKKEYKLNIYWKRSKISELVLNSWVLKCRVYCDQSVLIVITQSTSYYPGWQTMLEFSFTWDAIWKLAFSSMETQSELPASQLEKNRNKTDTQAMNISRAGPRKRNHFW